MEMQIEQEKIDFHTTEKLLQQQMITYTRDMAQMNSLSNVELKYLQQGIIFKSIKLGYFGMKAETLA